MHVAWQRVTLETKINSQLAGHSKIEFNVLNKTHGRTDRQSANFSFARL